MKAKLFLVLILLIGLFSCQKEMDVFNSEKVVFKNLRSEPHGLLTIVDVPREVQFIVDHGNMPDTVGETELFFKGDLLSHRNWETTYMTPLHKKTDFLYVYYQGIMMVIVKPDYIFSDRLYVVCDGITKDFSASIGEIKSSEVDLARRTLRITYNNSWIRTGEIPDETEEFKF